MARYLVTTALEETWPAGTPLLLLGEWCRRFDRRSHWESLDTAMAAPRGLCADEKLRDAAEVRRIAELLLREIAASLNAYHGERHELRYWRIVLGHWLLRYVSVIHNRHAALTAALATGEVSGTALMREPHGYSLASTDSDGFIWACDDDLWNHVLYGRILGVLARSGNACPVDHIAWTRTSTGQGTAPVSLMERSARWVGEAARGAMHALAGERDAVLVSTYLPLRQRINLELRLGQLPQVWRTVPAPAIAPDAGRRESLAVSTGSGASMEAVARELWPQLLPVCFLEGRPAVLASAHAFPFPRRPRFVFTANAFDTDEMFKAWVAGKTEEGVPYITAQHGSNYGTHYWWGAEFWPDRSASDCFLTWGWSCAHPPALPAFNLKTAGRRPREKQVNAGGLLLIEVALPHRISPHDTDAEFAIYQEEQFRFVEALPPRLRKELLVRLHAEYRRHRWGEEGRWAERAPAVRLDDGLAPARPLVDGSRLVVHSYDSTGILETLALNIPTMCFWHGGFEHVVPSALPAYRLLQDAGIFHATPDKAAAAVTACWDDVAAWWEGAAVQAARREFCDRYARTVADPVSTLKGLLEAVSAGANAASRQ